jgi:MOSC domain-containing protein YiiM
MEHLKIVPQVGAVTWLGVRPERGAPMLSRDEVELVANLGVAGDRYQSSGNRQVTLIQAEHLPVIAALASCTVTPGLLRRNVVVSGVNLLSLQKQRFSIGDAILVGTGACAPCEKMEAALGVGGFQAMRGHGGICARVERSGTIRRGDPVRLL